MPPRPLPTAIPMLAAAALLGLGCAGSEPGRPRQTEEAELRDEVAALQRSVEASYDREQALAERLRLAEESVAALRSQVAAQQEQIAGLGSPSHGQPLPGGTASAAGFDVDATYREALDHHQDRRFERSVAGFSRILARAPDSGLADNAQYWIGESCYVQGQYRKALSELTKVLAYRGTEKADDAQLMIARCYLALGEKEPAAAAFRKLLELDPDSEYAEVAREELRDLEGP